MPLPDPGKGSVYVWLVSSFLLVSVMAGGGFLILYMTQSQSPPWFPIAGVVLVCLPWFFWLFTFVYRLCSRVCGGRNGGGGGGVIGGGGARSSRGGGGGGGGGDTDGSLAANSTAGDLPSHESGNGANVEDVSHDSNQKHVHFGAAVVLGEQDGDKERKDVNQNNSTSSNNSNHDAGSHTSHESEMPLTLSMAS